jgi:hypothetical protein
MNIQGDDLLVRTKTDQIRGGCRGFYKVASTTVPQPYKRANLNENGKLGEVRNKTVARGKRKGAFL